ncbi:MAG: glycoside hydrolase family 3 N-terminal domain-containing protein [Syntrophobacteraceae bacterium]
MSITEPGIHMFVGFEGVSLEEELDRLIRDYRPGGIVLFRRNIEGQEQLKCLIADAQALALEVLKRPLLVAIDQEGGTVQRLTPHFTSIPAARTLSLDGPDSVSQWARKCAADLKEIGIQINFAPVLDLVPGGEDHFMESRTFGSVPAMVADLGAIWIEEHQRSGVSATAKHFPGLGRAGSDPHHFAPKIAEDSREEFHRHLIPFWSAVRSGVNCIMTSHAVYPAMDSEWPATLSHEIIRFQLRQRMHFGGVLFSDDLDMAAISENYSNDQIVIRGLSGGIDFFLLCQRTESIEPFFKSITALLEKDKTLQQFHADSLRRIEILLQFHFEQLLGPDRDTFLDHEL